MDRFFAFVALALLLALAPVRIAGEPDAQPVFFSLLFPQLAPQAGEEGLMDWLFGADDASSAGKVML